MPAVEPVCYAIDEDDRLIRFNAAWTAFAEANRGRGLSPADLTGRPLWDSIADATTVHLYKTMVARVRSGGPPVHFHFRCDAPRMKRLLRMDITREGSAEVVFTVTPVLEQARPDVAVLDSTLPRSERLLTMCGWCKQAQVAAGEWVEIEEAIDRLGLFQAPMPPRVTHGVCPTCYRTLMAALDQPGEDPDPFTLGPLKVA